MKSCYEVVSIQETLQRKGYLISIPIGDSMMPLIRGGRDEVFIGKPEEKIQKHDVILYRRRDGQLVLHRVLTTHDDGYSLCGDGQWKLEKGIKGEQILGVMKGFYRGAHYIDASNRFYRTFVFFWCTSLLLRRLILYILKLRKRIGREGFGRA